jgi:hypothetical protein
MENLQLWNCHLKTLEDTGTGYSFLNRTPVAQEIRARIDELKSFCTWKGTITGMERQSPEWEEISANYSLDKGLISSVPKHQKKSNPIINGQMIWADNSQKYEWQINTWESEQAVGTPAHPSWSGYHEENKHQMLARREGAEEPYIVGGTVSSCSHCGNQYGGA